jgi:hypothetical protein
MIKINWLDFIFFYAWIVSGKIFVLLEILLRMEILPLRC